MLTASIFFAGARISTWLVIILFVVFGLRDRRYLIAGAAWLTGFEVTFQMTSLLLGRPLPNWEWGPFFLIGLGLLTVTWAWRRGVRPSGWIVAAVAVLWLVWLATGFHVNDHRMIDLNQEGEALNEAAKTLWAVAYLWPLWRTTEESRPGYLGASPRSAGSQS